MEYKLGSLFDGSGGFPLAGSLCGITPVWAAEVEPYPIAVTRSRFPDMHHLGDISKVNGAEIEPVDIITFGSPCQDLSVAGKRAGLKHEANGDEETTRSGLFMEAVRIIKEMRKATGGQYPRFALWENVPGAFSSNKGGDFRVVCEELIKIIEPSAVMPEVPKNGWPYADSYVGDGWSLAYRVFDAQYWGVPQRRRRIHLVVDFRGERAREVLFEREGVRGYFAEGRTPWQGTTADAQGGTATADREGENENGSRGGVPYTLKIRSGCEGGGKGALIQTDPSATLATNNDQYLFQPIAVDGYNQTISDKVGSLRAGKSDGDHVGIVIQAVTDTHILDDQGGSQITVRTDGKSPTLRAEMHGNVPCVLEAAAFKAGNGEKAAGIGYQEEISPTLTGAPSGTNQVPTVCIKEQHLFENHSQDTRYKGPLDVCPMLPAQLGTGGNNTPFVVEEIAQADHNVAAYCVGNGQLNQISMAEQSNTLDCMHDQQAVVVFDKEVYNSGKNATGGHYIAEGGPCPSLRTEHPPGIAVHYIVRRLTPTECARLQGFADRWGDIDKKDSFTPEEYLFWLEVRNTHAAINGKAVKEYTEKQMLTWYNKLHTDSAEYKMWGNGIALPPALYCMQGIMDALKEKDTEVTP